ncbi:helix-turn-helix transcriptional regulator [Actinoplanes sp. N902-109]|uniref:helix-turn-helix domain-containing protein n=1 Tax=Actinoplanes sp. (strain N902-109) TaxID=649831 RepID=UPI00032940C8|nr:helix-turn-helix transcriptional regulator [Actinoplanes sp. N902-109]AGL14983.1 erythropoiesis-stimulating protein [Actinoplanes sp. N902-109]
MEHTVNTLAGLGLTDAAERVYRTMLRDPVLPVCKLSAELGCAESEVRSALDELARLCLIRQSWEDPMIMVPVSPEVGLASLLSREQQELSRRRQGIEASRSAVEALVASYAELRTQHPAPPDVEQVVGADAVRNRIEELGRQCRYELLTLAPDKDLSTSVNLEEILLTRGVSIRAVHLDSIRNDPTVRGYARWLTELGGDVRTTATLPARLLVLDREIAIVPVSATDPEAGVLVLRSSGAVDGLCALFDSVWRGALPWHARRKPRDCEGLTSQERVIMELLGQGHTDEVVARRLGVSVRTCRRIIADLMTRLHARSRFQAGACAQAAGWL